MRKDDSIGIQTKWTTIFPIIPIILGLYSEEVNDYDTKISDYIHEIKAQGEHVNTDGSSQGDPSDEHAETKAEVIEMVATAYTAGYESTGKHPSDPAYGITASGAKVAEGRTIACPPSLPFGTRLDIEGIGERVCEDRGGAITEGRIDVYFDGLEKAIQFGRQAVEVTIIDEG